jgi:hypothetical protein
VQWHGDDLHAAVDFVRTGPGISECGIDLPAGLIYNQVFEKMEDNDRVGRYWIGQAPVGATNDGAYHIATQHRKVRPNDV